MVAVLGRQVAVFSISAAGSGVADAKGLDMFAADEKRGGVAYVDIWDRGSQEAVLQRLRSHVEQTKAAMRVSFVVFSVCWGDEGGQVARTVDGRRLLTAEVPAAARSFARGLVEVCGASDTEAGLREKLEIGVTKCPMQNINIPMPIYEKMVNLKLLDVPLEEQVALA